jgi:tetratricopeptide (TPR) repeat protein
MTLIAKSKITATTSVVKIWWALRALLLRAQEKFPNDVDLIGVLGWVCRKNHPPRFTDARNCFQRSYGLNNRNEEMYRHRARMEMDLPDWTKSAEAAERGLEKHPKSKELLFLTGYAHSRLGQEMEARLQAVSAQDEQHRALRYLEKAIAIQDSGTSQSRDLNRQIYRAMVITCSKLQDGKKLADAFDSWIKEPSGDTQNRPWVDTGKPANQIAESGH